MSESYDDYLRAQPLQYKLRRRAERAGQKLEHDCDRALGEIEELLANVLKLKELMR